MISQYIEIYLDNPCVSTKVQLQQGLHRLPYIFQEELNEMEQRITKNVLSELAVSVDVSDAVKQIDALQKALDKLGVE